MASRRPPVASALLAVALLVSPAVAQSDATPIFGVGYTANAPRLLAGGSAWAVFPGLYGLGLYVDAKLSLDSPADNSQEFLPGRTAAEMEAEFPAHIFSFAEASYHSYNAALVKIVTPELMVYAGGGWVEWTQYMRYFDEQEEFGRLGFYWVEDPEASGGGVNLMGGGLLRLGSHLRVQFGLESRPRGFTVGAALNFPGR